ncbi:hypothetical protein HanRHA438_Chr09g0429861 [Helianthus annuus]|nr:hypothetical protein HanIR_Chr09g0450201 [Helianthus annuus]KAJ0890990.1 hypothetical protein HanRHA438_Chr09g0429861 [Helianthus annuus]
MIPLIPMQYMEMHLHCFLSKSSMEVWTPSECPTTITPPKHHTPIGHHLNAQPLVISARNQGIIQGVAQVNLQRVKVQGAKGKGQGAKDKAAKGQVQGRGAKGQGQAAKGQGAKDQAAKNGGPQAG